MAGPLTPIGFRELWTTLKTEERAKINFIKHAFVAEKAFKSTGEYLFPHSSTFMQMAVDDMAYDLTAAWIKQWREENRGIADLNP